MATQTKQKALSNAELNELLESWINGNRSFVRDQVRSGVKDARARLALLIAKHDSEEQAQKFIDGF